MIATYQLVEIETGAVVDCGIYRPEYTPEAFTWEWGSGTRLTALPGQFQLKQTMVEVELPVRTTVTPPEFKLLLTLKERQSLRAAAVADPDIADFLSIINDTRLAEIDLTSQSIIEMIEYVVSEGVITKERSLKILKGQNPS